MSEFENSLLVLQAQRRGCPARASLGSRVWIRPGSPTSEEGRTSREEADPVLLSSQGIPEGKTPPLGLFLSRKKGCKGLRISGVTSPRGLCPGRSPLENDILTVQMSIRWAGVTQLGHHLSLPPCEVGRSLCPPSCLTFHMATTRRVSNSRPPSTPTSTHQIGMALSSKTRSSCVCT